MDYRLRAFDHICCDKLLFTTLNNFSRSHLIGLPNDRSIQVTQYGIVPIHDKIILSQVLYVPEFKHNLISVAKITSQLKVWVIFTDDFCVMHAPSSKSNFLIGKR